MKATELLTSIILVSSTFCCTNAQPEPTKQESLEFIQNKINDNLYILKAPNYNTNMGVFIGTDAVLLIDPMAGSNNHKNLLNAISHLTNKPIKYVLNTHSHSDHSGSNKFFLELGASIISHENSKYSHALTDVTFDDRFTIKMGDETIELFHIKAHTIDDVLVYFSKNNVIFMGDAYMTNSYPHYYYGGGGIGHIRILDKAIALGDKKTIIVPAHGNLISNKEELITYRLNSISWIDQIKKTP